MFHTARALLAAKNIAPNYEGKIDIDDGLAGHIIRSAEEFVRKAYEVLEQIEK